MAALSLVLGQANQYNSSGQAYAGVLKLRMKNMIKRLCQGLIAGVAIFFTSYSFASCGATFCSVNTDWHAQGAWTGAGSRLDVRYEFIDQDRPMAGSDRVAVGEIPRHHDEVRTLNRNMVLGYSYNTEAGWGVNVQVPWVTRNHQHIQNHLGVALDERWDIAALGDARITLRVPLNADQNLGLLAGLKLPTGRTNISNDEQDVAERSLQPGTGSTDILLGIAHHAALSGPHSWFVQTLWQHAITQRDHYRPGDQLGVDLGWRYAFNNAFSATLQLNAQIRARDKGSNAEPEDSGSRSVRVSPGLVYAFSPDTQVYAFAQLPVYTHVNGVQLTASRNFAAGLSQRF